MAEPFADAADLASGWRPLTAAEAERARELVAKASRYLRAEFPQVDAKILAGLLDPDLVKDVVCDMVRRVLPIPVDQPAMTQIQQSAGPFSQGMTFSNPGADPYLTKADRRRLGMSEQRASTVDMFVPHPVPTFPFI